MTLMDGRQNATANDVMYVARNLSELSNITARLIKDINRLEERCATLEEAVKSNPTVKPHDEKTDRGNQPAPGNNEGACGCGNCLPGHEARKEDAPGEARQRHCEGSGDLHPGLVHVRIDNQQWTLALPTANPISCLFRCDYQVTISRILV